MIKMRVKMNKNYDIKNYISYYSDDIVRVEILILIIFCQTKNHMKIF